MNDKQKHIIPQTYPLWVWYLDLGPEYFDEMRQVGVNYALANLKYFVVINGPYLVVLWEYQENGVPQPICNDVGIAEGAPFIGVNADEFPDALVQRVRSAVFK